MWVQDIPQGPAPAPWYAQQLRRMPADVHRGFPHPGYLGSNAPLVPGRDNPFAQGGPGSNYGHPGGGAPFEPFAPLQPAGGMSLDKNQAQTPEEVADLNSPFARTSVLGLSVDLVPNESQEVCRIYAKGQVTAVPIWFTWAIRPGLDLDLAHGDSLNARIIIEFGAGGAQVSRVAPDIGTGSFPNDGADIPEPTGFGGIGGSIVVHGTYARMIATNTGTSVANHRTIIAGIASEAGSGRNAQPAYTTVSVALAAGAAASIGIPPYASHILVYRTNSGVTAFFAQVFRYLGGFVSVLDFNVLAGAQMASEIALPNGSSRVSLLNLGGVASSFNVMFRLNP